MTNDNEAIALSEHSESLAFTSLLAEAGECEGFLFVRLAEAEAGLPSFRREDRNQSQMTASNREGESFRCFSADAII